MSELFPAEQVSVKQAVPFTREHYNAECEKRWNGPALCDAKQQWHHWQELHDDLADAMRKFKRNPFQQIGGKSLNPEGTLTALLWKMQDSWQPDKCRLDPLLDFCDHYQKVHLRRGLVIYCTMLLNEEGLKP